MTEFELTSAQKGIADLQSFYGETSITTLCGAMLFERKLDTDILRKTLNILVKRHEALRLRFHSVNGRLFQYVDEPFEEDFEPITFSDEEEMRSFLRAKAKMVFAPDGGKMFELAILVLPGRTGVMLCASHLIADAWTYSILAKDIRLIYDQLSGEGPESDISSAHSQRRFTDTIQKQKTYLASPLYGKDKAYWEGRYSGDLEETTIRHGRETAEDPKAERYVTTVPEDLSKAAGNWSRTNRISVAALIESAMLLYLASVNGRLSMTDPDLPAGAVSEQRKPVTIGVPVLGRSGAKEKETAGLFMSTLPMTMQIDPDESVLALCRKTYAMHREIYRHRRFPYGEIVGAIREKTGFTGHIFDVLVSFQNAKTGVAASTEWFSSGYLEVPLAFHVDDRDGTRIFRVTVDYRTDVFTDPREIVLLAERIQYILHQMVTDPLKPVKDVSLLPPKEERMILDAWNETKEHYAAETRVESAFRAYAREHAEETAILFREESYSYRRIDQMSDALAAFLARKEHGSGDRASVDGAIDSANGYRSGPVVPIMARRHPLMIVSMLAVLKAGMAYMPVSPDYPASRVRLMLEEVGAKVMLTYGEGFSFHGTESGDPLTDNGESLGESRFEAVPGCEVIRLEDFDFSDDGTGEDAAFPLNGKGEANVDYPYDGAEVENKGTSDDLCYVIFTSGSTGKPKATMLSHRNVINYCAGNAHNVCGGILRGTASAESDQTKRDTIVSVTDFVFDIFVTESLLALLNGIRIVLADDDQVLLQKELSRLVLDHGVSVIQTTPTKLRTYMLDKSDLQYLRKLRVIILGGEALPMPLLEELRRYTKADIYNIYGPTETTVWSAFAKVDGSDITIGKPIANTQVYILDEELHPVPVGIEGEICIAGDGVGLGYLHRPELTAERFVKVSFDAEKVIYRTGDRGIFRADGSIGFCGRKDNQIKLRGLRIELGEIESAMCASENIELAAVVVRTNSGTPVLVGFFTSRVKVDTRALRQELLSKLPTYMVPNTLVQIDAMPMTPSGKLDRKALSDDASALKERGISEGEKKGFSSGRNPTSEAEGSVAPGTEREKILCDLVAQVLDLQEVGPDDDFFDMGGDSFAAIELASLAAEKGIVFPVRSIYTCRTVRNICAASEPTRAGNEDRAAVNDDPKTSRLKMDEEISRYPLKRKKSDLRFFRFFTFFTRKTYRFEVSGLENIIDKYIFCPNHLSQLDALWVWAALRGRIDIRDACTIVAAELLTERTAGRISRVSGGIPIEREGDFTPTMRRAIEVVREGKCLLIHPEGTRSRTGELGAFREGAARIALETGAKIIPVAITGSGEILPVGKKRPRLFDWKKHRKHALKIAFGTPIEPVGKEPAEITDEIRARIVDLLG
ncbi:MAG: AMP-binding protein [Clostridiales bacterium]|nr:AMP-binding protein [Clostridiales bacterium]